MPTPGCIALAVLAGVVAILVACLAVVLALRSRSSARGGVVRRSEASAAAAVRVVQDLSHLERLRAGGGEDGSAEEQRPLVVLFHTPWCQYCQRMRPHYGRTAQQLAGRYRFAEMDVKEQPQAVAALELEGFPTVVLFASPRDGGGVRAKRAGFCQDSELRRWLQQQQDQQQ